MGVALVGSSWCSCGGAGVVGSVRNREIRWNTFGPTPTAALKRRSNCLSDSATDRATAATAAPARSRPIESAMTPSTQSASRSLRPHASNRSTWTPCNRNSVNPVLTSESDVATPDVGHDLRGCARGVGRGHGELMGPAHIEAQRDAAAIVAVANERTCPIARSTYSSFSPTGAT